MRFADWPQYHVLHRVPAAEFQRRVLRRYSKHGQTVVALDMQDNELRDMLTEIRIIRDDGTHTRMNGLPVLTDAELTSKEIQDPVTINYLPPKKYPTGTLTFENTFTENGKYIGIVTVKRTGRDLCLPVPVCGGSTV